MPAPEASPGRSAPQAAKEQLDSRRFDVLITDIKMPGMTGMELLKEAKRSHPLLDVILITGYGTIESAVEAMKSGAFEYILKPFYNDEILHLLGRIGEIRPARGTGGCRSWVQRLERALAVPFEAMAESSSRARST